MRLIRAFSQADWRWTRAGLAVDHACVGRHNSGSSEGGWHALAAVYRDSEGGDASDVDARAAPGAQRGAEEELGPAHFTFGADRDLWLRRAADETTWQIGGSGEVAWIAANTRPGRTIATAIPPIFDAYATVTVPAEDADKRASDEALLGLIRAQGPPHPWWLGYLETGASDVVFPNAPRIRLYADWPYVLVKAGPDQAATWRPYDDATPWHSALPELMFPLDHSWIVSTLWDDDWRCIGGPTTLVEAVVRHPMLDAHTVAPNEDIPPPEDHDP